ncbi:MAG: response regulator transcription factor [Hyphomonas sp.]|uniref:response regulator transcription factor n=1 Tax=Hyphomonas sp. TaxID=87 RepID=UPI0017CE9649|nr:response regulator transcription factor [Hyphomonas sp.]MBA3068192.1 response regulator transcription factor [Hyphomonas sp.]MBU3919193.1 response regulator transcription factor [Alphaproteobacteria bacterium]MBU4062115.1 response regulator transcription factor [Alphaproteobacteria bacterium]MBU4165550.1 response regulator transcription factor [Alphaproteobacteria bacterium]
MSILIVEDDIELVRRISRSLSQAGFAIEHAQSGLDAVAVAASARFEAIILDLGLPGLSGIEVLKQLRGSGNLTPIIILSARGTWTEKVEGLRLGADDYLTKPFHSPELVARVEALVRRSTRHATPVLVHGNIELDIVNSELRVDGVAVEATSLEYRLLRYLMQRAGRIVSQSELVEALYATAAMRESNTVEVYISRLRRKIGKERIKTVRGLGYRFG